MNVNTMYRSSALAMILIGIVAVLVLWLGGWGIACFMEANYGLALDPIRACIPFGHARIPFWPAASLVLFVMHGVFMFRYGEWSARLGVPSRLWDARSGAYDARVENPFANIIAKDFVVIGILLIIFLILCVCHHWFGWCWWGC